MSAPGDSNQVSLAGGRKWWVWGGLPFRWKRQTCSGTGFFMRWALGQLLSLPASRFSPTCIERLPPPELDCHFGQRLGFFWILEHAGTFTET